MSIIEMKQYARKPDVETGSAGEIKQPGRWYKSLKFRSLATLFATVASFFALQDAAHASSWYVSNLSNATTTDGTSWATAWPDFSSINWSQVQPGDNIQIDAGSSPYATVTYSTPLVVQKSNILISVPSSPLHGQGLVQLQPSAGSTAIDLQSYPVQNVTIQGSQWMYGTAFYIPGDNSWQSMKYSPNFRVSTNYRGTGVAIGPNAKNIVLSNLHLLNNNTGLDLTGGTTYAYYLMINQNGFNVRSRPTAGAQGQYAYLYYSWLFNAQSNSMTTNVYCSSDPASQFDLKFYYSILGPGFYNALFTTSPADSVSGTYTLFLNNDIDLTCANAPRNANLTYDILFKTPRNNFGSNSNLSFAETPNTSVFGSIVYGGNVAVRGSNLLGMYNEQFNTTGNTVVLSSSQQNPNFASNVSGLGNQPSFYTLTTLDLTPANGTPGTPYCIHSVDDLYARVPKAK